jgi:hypothetical protein
VIAQPRREPSGAFLGKIGRPGKQDGEFDTRGPNPVLVVADRGNRRLQAFTLEGTLIRTIKDEAHPRMPCYFHMRGDLKACPDLDSHVCLLDRSYNVVVQLGDGQPRGEFTPGKFISPHAAIFLANGNILVAEWLPNGRQTLLGKAYGPLASSWTSCASATA